MYPKASHCSRSGGRSFPSLSWGVFLLLRFFVIVGSVFAIAFLCYCGECFPLLSWGVFRYCVSLLSWGVVSLLCFFPSLSFWKRWAVACMSWGACVTAQGSETQTVLRRLFLTTWAECLCRWCAKRSYNWLCWIPTPQVLPKADCAACLKGSNCFFFLKQHIHGTMINMHNLSCALFLWV